MKILRRFGVVESSSSIKANINYLKERQNQQLTLLVPLKENVDHSFINLNLIELAKIKSEKVFNSFATRCLNQSIRELHGLADVNIERVFEKQSHCKIPFTVKDHIKIQGMVQTCGFADNVKPANYTADVVSILEKQGCIAFAHSNVPQGLLGIQSQNPVYGLSLNPHNSKFLSGGSSGGEGTLVASKACAFGLGSDSAGSVRIPAAFCGTYGFKPTGSKRLSNKGRVGPSGVQGLKIGDLDSCLGYLTRNFDDISWLCEKTIGKNVTQYDPFLYGQWNSSRYEASKRKKLTVGYIYTNHQMRIAPGLVNTINQTLQKLKSKGHRVVEFEFPKLHQFRNFFFSYVYQSGFLNGMYQRMEGHTSSQQIHQFYDLHLFGKIGLSYKELRGQDVQKDIFSIYKKKPSKQQFFKIHKELEVLKKLFYQEWYQKDIDILLSPTMPFTAPFPDTTDLLVYQLSYCCFQNILELPSGVIPTRLVREDQTTYQPVNAFEKKIAPAIWQSKGLPLSIQVTGKHMEDQQCLGAMWEINKWVGNFIDPILK